MPAVKHASARGLVVGVAAAVLAFAALVAGPAQTARASFATQCASPTSILDPSAGSVSVAPGQTVLLATGTFTGGVNALPSGATLCVASGAALNPAYMNNAEGSLVVAAGGSTAFSSVAVGTGFALVAEGSAVFGNLNVNGASAFTIGAAGSLTVNSGFSPGSGTFVNLGTMRINGTFSENTNVVVRNASSLVITGGASLNGTVVNTGTISITGALTVNGSASFSNSCRVQTTAGLTNGSADAQNAGVIVVGGVFSNNGTWRQTVEGLLAAAGLVDDGRVNGFGSYQFNGPTSAQGQFVGDAPGNPILVQTQAPAGSIFDVQTGTVANVVRLPSTPPVSFSTAPTPGCSDTGSEAPFADVSVTKTGPGTVLVGGDVTYTLTVINAGPAPANGVILTDTLPTPITAVVDAGGGTVSSATISWTLGTLAAASTTTRTFTISQAAPVGTVLHDAARTVSTTADPNPSNNNGTSADSQADTTVVAVAPPTNTPPTANPLTAPGFTGVRLSGQVIATDPDPDQSLTYTITTPPAHGIAGMIPGGLFAYQSDIDFSGDDSFVYTACDDGTPVECASATVSLPISPIARNDDATTFASTAVVIPVTSNDTLGAALDPTLVAAAGNGTTVVDPATGDITYTPNAGFTGTDTFTYRLCSPTSPTLCDTATVTVTVVAVNNAPVLNPLHLVTTTGTPVSGTITAVDPNLGQTIEFTRGVPPRSGIANVTGDSTTYSPGPGFAGRDTYLVIGCDTGSPTLCGEALVTVDVYPIANPNDATTVAGTAVTIPVTDNDLGIVSAPTITTPPSNGTVVVSGTSVVYTPDPGFTGTDSFTYTICAAIAPDLCSTTTVTIVVTASSVVPPTPTPPTPPDTGTAGGLADTGGSGVAPWALWLALLGTAAGAATVVVDRARRIRRTPRSRP